MSSKMDRAGVRTPAQLEQKYALGKLDKSFAQMIGVAEDARTTAEGAKKTAEGAKKTAEDAQTAAEDAKKTAENVDKNLDHEEIFNRLTKNGTLQGLYEENGQVYFNASYIKSGKIRSDVIDVNVGLLEGSFMSNPLHPNRSQLVSRNLLSQAIVARIGVFSLFFEYLFAGPFFITLQQRSDT